jgi:hypothetical protein
MTKIKYIIPTATALLASALGLATAPAQAATVNHIGCASTSFCTLPELFSGGSITVDENMDGKIDKTFRNWMRTGAWTPPSGLQVTGFGSTTPLSAGLTFTTTNGWTTPPSFANQFLFDVVLGDPLNVSLTQLELYLSNSSANGTSLVSVTANSKMVENAGGTLNPSTGKVLIPLSPNGDMINVTVSGSTFSFPPIPSGTASVRSFSLTFGQGPKIPEPGTVVGLLAVGGLGLAMKRRQKDS